MSKLTKDELETLEWICLVGSLKIKELEEIADSEKMVLLQKHKENIMKLMTKNWNEKESNKKVTFFFILLLTNQNKSYIMKLQ